MRRAQYPAVNGSGYRMCVVASMAGRSGRLVETVNTDTKCIPLVTRRMLSRLLFGLALVCGQGGAQTFPTKPVRIIVPYAAGGITDIATRIVAIKMGESMGQPVIVDNRPGASGVIGSDLVAKALPDGYTLLATSTTHTVISTLIPKLPFDPVTDFVPIAVIASSTSALVVNSRSPFKTVSDLVAYAKANPGKLSFASGGNGALAHLTSERFKREAVIDIVHIPYKGGGPASADLMGGHVSLFFDVLTTSLPNIKAGNFRALAVSSSERSPLLPGTPTMIESGFPGFTASAWVGLLAPAGTPRAIIDKINAELLKALQTSEVKEGLSNLATVPGGGGPEQFQAFLTSETARWSKVIKDAGIKNE